MLESGRDGRDAVPLDLELPADRRLLVVSGPNAGGKTVVLKTAGLFAMLAQCGVPLPAGPGTRVPVFRSIHTEIGDAQAILSDRSTFSSSMEILAGILSAARPGALALIDEIGGATDPEEGSALAVAFLEAYLESGGRAIATTHLGAIKTFAGSRPDALCAAMEFDEKTGRPNYRLHPGLAGRSRALSVAEDRGIPERVLERARAILGEAWQRRERAETEAEQALERLRQAERDLAAERDAARREAASLEEERRRLEAERSRMLADGLASFERARAELARRVQQELDEARAESSRRTQLSAARVLEEAERAVAEESALADAREAREASAQTVEPGQPARVRGLGVEGRVLSFDGDWAHMEIQGKRLRVRRTELEPARAAAGKAGKAKSPSRGIVSTPLRSPDAVGVIPEVHVIGQRLEEALEAVERSIRRSWRARRASGSCTGTARAGSARDPKAIPRAPRGRAPPTGRSIRGGNGATILELR